MGIKKGVYIRIFFSFYRVVIVVEFVECWYCGVIRDRDGRRKMNGGILFL